MTCTSCSRAIPEGSRFCPHCGAASDAVPFDATRTSAASRGVSATSSSDHGRFVPGTMLGGRYRIVGLLGRGGMGEVYRADDLKLGQSVALKFLPAVVENDPSRLQRFLNEVKIARQISHPNVCRVYDVGEVDGHHYLSMEYVDGEDLAILLRRIGRLPGDKAIQIARQLCAGLAAAHDKGVLHRDLKPANVMLDGEGRVRITDFGLAAIVGQVTGADVHAGTPGYMAPEQIAGKEVSVASDIFSLGIVLFELFTGKPVFKADSRAELERPHQENRTSPSSFVPDLDSAVERVILRCLSQNPAERPTSALAVAAALPGGDPLAAALAAGETPSPEMVAAAGEAGGLRPLTAWLALAAVVILLVPLVALQSRIGILGRTPLPKEPQVLKAEARALLKEAGYPDAPSDTLWGFDENKHYLDELGKLTASDRWDRLGAGPRSGLIFWYRESPKPLIPMNSISYRMSVNDPPSLAPGMATAWMDPSGNLLRMEVVPPESDQPVATGATTPPMDWSRLLAAANLRLGSYVATYVERDVRQLLNIGDLVTFQTFLKLCAGRSGQLLNLSALASDCGMTHGTARAWISVLEAGYIAFRLPPFVANPNKRLVKTPKLFFYDTGLLCYLLGIRHSEQLRTHPLRGAIFETWVASEILKARAHRGLPPALLFFRDRKGAEVDLLVERGDALVAVEAKSSRTVAGDFFDGLEKFAAIVASQKRMPPLRQVLLYAGEKRQERTGVTVLPWSKLHDFDWAGKQES